MDKPDTTTPETATLSSERMKLSDYVVDFLAQQGVQCVFGLTGGAVVHLFDSAARHPTLQPVFAHHEQAAAFATVGYAQATDGLGACFVTTGPGATNALTGLAAAWLDSLPCVFISGQTRASHTSRGKGIRQLGTQEMDIVTIVQSMTNYATMIESAQDIRYELEKAVHLARTGRPGPVWLDLPLDLQWVDVNPSSLRSFEPPSLDHREARQPEVDTYLRLLSCAERPLLLIGLGARRAGAGPELTRFLDAFDIPFVTTWGACDLVASDHPRNIGRPGVAGQRGANLAVQNSDLLLVVGSHLAIPLTGTMFDAFAREAIRVVVDIDPVQLAFETVRVDHRLQMDARSFLGAMTTGAPQEHKPIAAWKERCKKYRSYNAVPTSWANDPGPGVNHYVFVNTLSDLLEPDDRIVVDGGGTNVYVSFQALKLQSGQRVIHSSALGAMGSGLPEAIGVAFAEPGRRVVCLCGDGSFQLNVHELQTLAHHRLPVKLFVIDNGGYVSIRQTQDGFLDGRHAGSERAGGMSLPDFQAVARAYGLPAFSIDSSANLNSRLAAVLRAPGPAVCVVRVPFTQQMVPTQGFVRKPDGTYRPRPLEDMAPLLERSEFLDAMIVKPWDDA